jgi:hypothetical protein
VLNTPGTQTETSTLVQQLTGQGVRHATAKVYSTDGLTQAGSAFAGDIPINAQNESNVPESFVVGFVSSFTAGSTSPGASTEAPGSHGGFMECGLRTDSVASVSFCAWSDGHTFGVVTDTHGTTAQAYALALELRASDGH